MTQSPTKYVTQIRKQERWGGGCGGGGGGGGRVARPCSLHFELPTPPSANAATLPAAARSNIWRKRCKWKRGGGNFFQEVKL